MPVVQGSMIDFDQGPLARTEGSLDVALSGPGFLTVEAPDGAHLYTRNGAFVCRRRAVWRPPKATPYSTRAALRSRSRPARKIHIGDSGMIARAA